MTKNRVTFSTAVALAPLCPYYTSGSDERDLAMLRITLMFSSQNWSEWPVRHCLRKDFSQVVKHLPEGIRILLSEALNVLSEEKEGWDAGQTSEGTLNASECSSSKLSVVFCFSARSNRALKEASGWRLVYSGSLARLHDGADLFNR